MPENQPAAPDSPTGDAAAKFLPRRGASRRRFLSTCAFAAAALAGTGAYAWQIEPYWVQYHDLPMPIRNLPPSFVGMRLAHLSDLHIGDRVPMSYLQKVVDRVVDSRPDLIVVTGDILDRGESDHLPDAVELVTRLGKGAYISLGNHDYGVYESAAGGRMRKSYTAEDLERRLNRAGLIVLRNRSKAITHPDGRLWMVGLDDLWGGYFLPTLAFADVPDGEPRIALSHNPDTAPDLLRYKPDWVLCGHTHGGQVRLPLIGALKLPVRNKQYDQGVFELGDARMYVSRGVGYLKPVRFLCRPEVTTFVLQRA